MATKSPRPKKTAPKDEPGSKLETEIVSTSEDIESSHQEQPTVRRAPIGRLFWGLFFVAFGGLFLLQNLDIVDVDFSEVWQLWPIIIILFGLSLLSVKSRLWRSIAIITAIISVAVIVAAALGYMPRDNTASENSSISISQETSDVRSVNLSVKSGAGNLSMSTHDSDQAVIATLDSDIATLNQSSAISDGVHNISLSTDANIRWWLGSFRNDLTVSVTERQPVDLTVDFGASSADIDLRKAKLNTLKVKTGASSLVAKIGSKVDRTTVDIEAGASSVELHLPSASGVRVELESGLSSTDLQGLDDKGNGVWESPGFDEAEQTVAVTAKIGAGSLDLKRY